MAEPPEELTAFCRAEFPRLVGIVGLYLGDRDTAEELAQETLLRAASRWSRVSRLDSPTGWTYRVAINLARSHARRRRTARLARPTLIASERFKREDPDTPDRLAVRDAVARLPERQRVALVLRWFADLDVPEVSRIMDCSEDAVRSLTKRALAALRDELQDPLLDEEDSHV